MPASAAEDRAAPESTALQVTTTGPPHRVHGSDGREHIEFNLVITNIFPEEVTLTSLAVRAGGESLLKLEDDALAESTLPISGGEPTRTIPSSSAVATQVDVVMPRSAGRNVPKRVSPRIAYTFAPGSPVESVFGSKVVRGAALEVDRRAPIVIAPPLRGAGWANLNGCCGDPSSPHRLAIIPADGTWTAFETFAIDYLRVVDDAVFAGDGSQNTDWFGYGAPIHSVADGKVVSVVDGREDIPPLTDNPNLTSPSDYCGNGVVVKIAPGQFASYCHLEPGSVRVEVGDRVGTGTKLGRLGNSGNTSGPHLHFGINAGADIVTSDSLPFEIDRYRFEGTGFEGTTADEGIIVTPDSQKERKSHPLINSISDYSR